MDVKSSIINIPPMQYNSQVINPLSDYVVTTTWANVTNWSLTIPADGIYVLNMSTSAQVVDSDSNSNAELYLRLARNGIAITGTMRRISHTATGISQTVPVEISVTVELIKNTVITLQAYKPNAGDTCTVCGNTGALGAIPNFSYNLITGYVTTTAMPIPGFKSFNMTIKATVVDPTKGTIVVEKAYYRRIGSIAEIIYNYRQSAGGTSGNGDYVFMLPEAMQIDTTLIEPATTSNYAYGVVGSCQVNTAAIPAAVGTANAFTYAGGDGILLMPINTSGIYQVSASIYALGAAVTYSFQARVPIQGW